MPPRDVAPQRALAASAAALRRAGRMLRFPGLWRLRNAAVTVHPRAREDPSMARRTDDLRLAVGAALRRLRNQGHFSLDDIQRGTSEHGVRVTRSHLSRFPSHAQGAGGP